MISQVLTYTLPNTGELHLYPTFKTKLNRAFEQLSGIIVSHIELKDELSVCLRLWGAGTLRLDLESSSENDIVCRVGARVARLAHDILVDPITRVAFKTPVIVPGNDRQWVLEQSQLPPIREIDEHRIGNIQDYPIHRFALEMVQWVDELVKGIVIPPDGRSQVTIGELLRLRTSDSCSAFGERVWRLLVKQAMTVRDARRKELIARKEVAQLQLELAEMEELMTRRLTLHEQELAAREERIRSGLRAVDQAHQNEVSVLNGVIEEQNRSHTSANAALQQTTDLLGSRLNLALKQINVLSEERTALEGRVQQLVAYQYQLQARVSSLENQDQGGSFCSVQ